MVKYIVIFSKLANKDKKLLKQVKLDFKAKELIDIISENPFQNPPSYEKLRGNLMGCYSRKINIQHRLVYEIDEDKKEIFILRMWSHYEKI